MGLYLCIGVINLNIKLQLRDKQTKKTKAYVCDFVSLETYEQALKAKELGKQAVANWEQPGMEFLEEGIKLLVKLYEEQFTFQQCVEGMSPDKAFEIILEHINICLGELKEQSLI